MLRSRSNTLVSVRQVTQRNAGRRTAGVDGEVALTPRQRMELANRLQCQAPSGEALPGTVSADDRVLYCGGETSESIAFRPL
jgi:hypothetical protein